jgi:alpha-galactosidase
LPQSLVVVPLNKRFKRFKATVGIDAATNGRGSVRFRVGDGTKTLWDSQDMNYYTEPKTADVDVSDAIILMMWVDDCGDGNLNDIANWASARLEMK